MIVHCLVWYMFKLIYKSAYICILKTPYHVTCDMTWSGAGPASPAWRSGSGRCRRRTNTSLTPPQPRQVVRLRGVDLQIYKLQSGSQQVDSLLEPANLLFLQKKVFLNTMASWLGWCIHVLLFVGLPLQKNSTYLNMITRQPAKPHKLVRLLAVELAECKQHHKVSDTWTGWPGRPCTESLTDLRNCHSIGQNWEEQNANAFNIIQSFYRFSNFKNWKK